MVIKTSFNQTHKKKRKEKPQKKQQKQILGEGKLSSRHQFFWLFFSPWPFFFSLTSFHSQDNKEFERSYLICRWKEPERPSISKKNLRMWKQLLYNVVDSNLFPIFLFDFLLFFGHISFFHDWIMIIILGRGVFHLRPGICRANWILEMEGKKMFKTFFWKKWEVLEEKS